MFIVAIVVRWFVVRAGFGCFFNGNAFVVVLIVVAVFVVIGGAWWLRADAENQAVAKSRYVLAFQCSLLAID